jgi:hypothetical protein
MLHMHESELGDSVPNIVYSFAAMSICINYMHMSALKAPTEFDCAPKQNYALCLSTAAHHWQQRTHDSILLLQLISRTEALQACAIPNSCTREIESNNVC